jgi:hypothetical protein
MIADLLDSLLLLLAIFDTRLCLRQCLYSNLYSNLLTCFILIFLYWCCLHHIVYETLSHCTILLYALCILWQLKWPLAGRLILGGRPPL